MRVRHKETKTLGHSSGFNIHSVSEIIVYYECGCSTSEFIKDYEVQLKSGEWVDMATAFRNHDLICDNFNTRFFEPDTKEDRERGYAL